MEALTPSPSTSPRIVFAGTASFAVPTLVALQEEGYSVVGVVTQPDRPKGRGQTFQPPPVKLKAFDLRIPVFQPQTLKNDEAKNLFTSLSPDLLVVVAYGKLLPSWLVAAPRYGVVNLHGSLLPRYRGAAPIQWAMANGDAETGVCLMQIDEGLDTGPVFACEVTPIHPEESVETLSNRLAVIGANLMRRSVPAIIADSLHPVPQDASRASSAPILTKGDGILDWRLPARTIHNRVRAFHPWPGSRTSFRGAPCRILRTRVAGRPPELAGLVGSPELTKSLELAKSPELLDWMKSMEPGVVLVGLLPVDTGGEMRRGLAVVCGDGVLLELLEVQLPNKKSQSGLDLINGLRMVSGEKFERAE